MKDRIIKTQNKIAVFLLLLVFLLVVVVTVNILESEQLIHLGYASGWYVSVLNAISISQKLT